MQRGQAFDAFKLLIAAVIAGAILVILLNILGGITITTQEPKQVMVQMIGTVKGSPGSGSVSQQVVKFTPGTEIGADGIASSAGVNPGSIKFCTEGGPEEPCCREDYKFTDETFTGSSPESLTVGEPALSGKVRVYYDGKQYCVGFTKSA
jgi:hypothetical protein